MPLRVGGPDFTAGTYYDRGRSCSIRYRLAVDHSAPDVTELRRELACDGAPVLASAIPKRIYATLLSRFGSIAQARAAAGLPATVPAKRRWSEPTVLAELRRLHKLGVVIRDRDLKDAGHSGLVEAAKIYCGGLVRARRLARISIFRRIQRDRAPWDSERVVSEIGALLRDGRSIASSKVDARLYCAARRYFGTWAAAIEAAGLDYDGVRMHAPSYAVDELLEQLRALAAAEPALLSWQLEAHQLGYMLRRRFPSLADAVAAAGIAGWPRRARKPLPTAEDTLAAIAKRRADGHSLAATAVRADDRSLQRAAQRHFGSWREAVAAVSRTAPVTPPSDP
jgi:hypothetical protein